MSELQNTTIENRKVIELIKENHSNSFVMVIINITITCTLVIIILSYSIHKLRKYKCKNDKIKKSLITQLSQLRDPLTNDPEKFQLSPTASEFVDIKIHQNDRRHHNSTTSIYSNQHQPSSLKSPF